MECSLFKVPVFNVLIKLLSALYTICTVRDYIIVAVQTWRYISIAVAPWIKRNPPFLQISSFAPVFRDNPGCGFFYQGLYALLCRRILSIIELVELERCLKIINLHLDLSNLCLISPADNIRHYNCG